MVPRVLPTKRSRSPSLSWSTQRATEVGGEKGRGWGARPASAATSVKAHPPSFRYSRLGSPDA